MVVEEWVSWLITDPVDPGNLPEFLREHQVSLYCPEKSQDVQSREKEGEVWKFV
jgi:hypothetical protein